VVILSSAMPCRANWQPGAVLLLLCAAILSPNPGSAQQAQAIDLAELSLEELANIEVTSVSRRPEPISDAAASIFVITSSDIRRSGARTLPEALRLAPNLQVARVNANGYAISARGFNNSIGNKLLVLIDGRTVYTPLFSGVFWDAQDVLLEDVDRIEVISGPGATLWGANAVNGVINVITRAAEETQGTLLSAGGGDEEVAGAARFGGRLGDSGHFRVYGKALDRRGTSREVGTPVPDRWQQGQVGFRADWTPDDRRFTLQGDAYAGEGEERPLGGAIEVSGFNLVARWIEPLTSGSSLQVKAYFDRSRREDRIGFQGDVGTVDLELQHAIPLERQSLLWGAGYRRAEDELPDTILGPLVIAFVPPSRELSWVNLFVQDEVRLSPSVAVTAGWKLERNDYTGWEHLPSLRLAWKPDDSRLLWGAVSRAVRAPARLDRDFTLTLLPGFPVILGGPDFVSEVAEVYELGCRAQPASAFSYSITVFRADYEKLRSGQPPPAFIENRISGPVSGIEAWATVQPAAGWRLMGGLTVLDQDLEVDPGSTDPTGPSALGNDPDHQWLLRSWIDLPGEHEIDLMVRHVDSLPEPAVPAYTAVDARWGWWLPRGLELSLTLQNLFDGEHVEFGSSPGRSVYGRSAFLKLSWRAP
jgi:iron complex outermembrane receptor protein